MQGALVILAVLVAVGLLLFYFERHGGSRHHHTPGGEQDDKAAGQEEEVCCGLHAVCEKKYSTPADTIIYYDDEELDVLAHRNPATYTETELTQLRNVVLTLRPEDAWGWHRSLEQRHIELPPEIRDELMLLMQ